MFRPPSSIRPTLAALACALAVLAAACGGPSTPADATGTVSLPSSPTALPTFDAQQFRQLLTQLHGQPVVVNLWASWCGPCITEAPALAQVARRFQGSVQFLGVDLKDKLVPARAFIQRYGWTYPSVFDPDGSIQGSLGFLGQPVTVMYSASGQQAFLLSGPSTEEALMEKVQSLVASSS